MNPFSLSARSNYWLVLCCTLMQCIVQLLTSFSNIVVTLSTSNMIIMVVSLVALYLGYRATNDKTSTTGNVRFQMAFTVTVALDNVLLLIACVNLLTKHHILRNANIVFAVFTAIFNLLFAYSLRRELGS